jgi:hypothetical protein
LDIAITDAFNVAVYLGDGAFGFAAPRLDTSAPEPHGLGVADFNLDGVPDLVVGSFGGPSMSVLIGVGDGTFTRIAIAVPGYCDNVAAADFNTDGALDVACTDPISAALDVALGICQ